MNALGEFREFFKQKTAYEICACLVGSEMCIRDRVEGDGEEAKAKRHRLEDRAAEVKAHLNELNKQLEELEATHRERREEKE